MWHGGQQVRQGSSQTMQNEWNFGQPGQEYYQGNLQGEANPNSLGCAADPSHGNVREAAGLTQSQLQPQANIVDEAGTSSKINGEQIFTAFIILILHLSILYLIFFQLLLDNIHQ